MITYTNIIHDKVLAPLEALLEGEFGIPVSYDHFEGTESFSLLPQSDNLLELLSVGQARSYNVLIDYRFKTSEPLETFIGHVTRRAERVKRLIDNNSATANWQEGKIASIEYLHDEELPEYFHAQLVFECVVTEVV